MKGKHILTISVLIAVLVVSFIVIRKALRKKLIASVTAKYGDIPNLDKKTNEELKEMLASGENP